MKQGHCLFNLFGKTALSGKPEMSTRYPRAKGKHLRWTTSVHVTTTI